MYDDAATVDTIEAIRRRDRAVAFWSTYYEEEIRPRLETRDDETCTAEYDQRREATKGHLHAHVTEPRHARSLQP